MNNFFKTALLVIGILVASCSKDSNGENLDIKNPYKLVHISPDSCKTMNLEERNFTIKIPDSFKVKEQQPGRIHYLSIEKGGASKNEMLQLAPAEIDLTIYSQILNKKVEGKNGYKLLFQLYKPLIDKYILEKGMKLLVKDFCNYPTIYVYSKRPNDQIEINDFPANYSEVVIHYESQGTEVWQQYVYFIIPNPDNLKKSLTGEYVREVYNTNKGISKSDFLESDSFKIVSNIEFIN